MKGAPERVLRQCTSYRKKGTMAALTGRDLERLNDAAAAMASKGLRGWCGCVI